MQKAASPRETLSIADATAIIVGMVVGVGIFKTPSIVAASAGSEGMLILFWFAGGIASLIGALGYAELASTHPHAGGDYHYLSKAFGKIPAFFYGWGRLSVIQTGSIVMVAFIIGDYASEILFLGAYSTSLYAAAAVVVLTALNVAGLRQSKVTQKALIGLIVLGLAGIAVCGFWLGEPRSAAPAGPLIPESAALGTAMIFVLLTYGGWNEAAFLSAEVKSPRQNMVKVLLLSIAVVTVIYVLVNLALLKGLGLSDMASSSTVMADLMRRIFGELGARFVSILILAACLSTMNAAVITGARTAYAVGQDYPVLGFLGHWHGRRHTPVNALLFQGGVALLLVALGTSTRSGFVVMVEYTAPVFWLFFLMVGVSVFLLRTMRSPGENAFVVPFFPVIPAVFCLICLYMLYSSLVYTGLGAIIGMGVLASGIPLLVLNQKRRAIGQAGDETQEKEY